MSNAQALQALTVIHKTVKLRAIRTAVEELGKDPNSVEDNTEVLKTIASVFPALSSYLMEEITETLAREERCFADQVKMWFTAVSVHGSVEAAVEVMHKED